MSGDPCSKPSKNQKIILPSFLKAFSKDFISPLSLLLNNSLGMSVSPWGTCKQKVRFSWTGVPWSVKHNGEGYGEGKHCGDNARSTWCRLWLREETAECISLTRFFARSLSRWHTYINTNSLALSQFLSVLPRPLFSLYLSSSTSLTPCHQIIHCTISSSLPLLGFF